MNNVFHKGEIHIQEVMGVRKESSSLASMIKDFIPPIAKEFLEELNFCVVSLWKKDIELHSFVVYHINSFITVIDDKNIIIDLKNYSYIDNNFNNVEILSIGLIGLDFKSKKRLRISGKGKILNTKLEINIEQIYSNCPKYITKRTLVGNIPAEKRKVEKYTYFTDDIKELISSSDTFFISSYDENSGVDVSYKGGEKGFVNILDSNHLKFIDKPGNNFFNTLGNIHINSYINMIFIDFKKGDTYLLKGNATINKTATEAIILVKCETILIEKNSFLLKYEKN